MLTVKSNPRNVANIFLFSHLQMESYFLNSASDLGYIISSSRYLMHLLASQGFPISTLPDHLPRGSWKLTSLNELSQQRVREGRNSPILQEI